MADVRVVIRLVIGEDDGGWVTSVPLERRYSNEPLSVMVAQTAQRAAGMFIDSIQRDRETITERIVRAEVESRG